MSRHTFEEILKVKKYKEEKLGIRLESYEEFLNRNKVYNDKIHKGKCFVFGCTKDGFYEGGDSRYYCAMCEEHAHMKEKYIREMENVLGV